jgi:hypothetical protein
MSFMFNLSEYTTVSERIKLFREMFPMGRIITKLIYEDANRVVFTAELYRDDEDERPFSTGYAREITSDRGVNKDFALENCETSAIGIAAKNAGIGTEKNSISREEAEKVNRVKAKDATIQEVKAKMAQTSGEYIPVVKEDDPWTIKPATMPPTMGEAVATVKEIIGGQTEKDIPKCAHGDMMWKTGTTKAGKPWGHFKCKAAVTGEIGGRCESPNDVIWYEISKEGAWQRQKARM